MSFQNKTKAELIREIKRLEKQLGQDKSSKKSAQQSSSRYADNPLFRHAANLILIVNRKGEIVDINRVSGQFKRSEVIGKPCYSFADPECKKIIRSAITRVFSTKKVQEYEAHRRNEKGTISYYKNKVAPVIDKGKVVLAIIDLVDITSEIEVQHELQNVANRFKALAENARDVIFRYQVFPEYKQEYLSPSIYNLSGYTAEEFYRDPALSINIIHPDDREMVTAERSSQNVGKPFILRWVHKKGSIAWIETINTAVRDTSGRIIAWEGISRDVTKQQMHEWQLQQEKQKAQTYLDIAGVVLVAVGRDLRVSMINRMGCELLGYDESEIVGKNWVDHFVSRKLRKGQKESFRQFFNGEQPTELFKESEILTKDGRRRMISWNSSLVYDENGKAVSCLSSGQDITDRLLAEQALRESETKFRMLAENASDVVYRLRTYPRTGYEYISPSIYALSGYTPEELYADPDLRLRLVHPDDLPLLKKSEMALRSKISGDEMQPAIVLRWIRKDGGIVWTETLRKRIVRDGRVIAIEGISRDITLKKQGEEKLRESEERFKILSNATFEGIIFTEKGRIIDANDQFMKIMKFSSRAEFLGKNIIDDFVMESQREISRGKMRLPKSDPFEVQVEAHDGSVITLEVKGQNIPYFGRIIRATVIYDITERKQYEYNLRESERTLSTLMNNLPGMAFRCEFDEQWTMRFVSRGFMELTGYDPHDIINNRKRAFADLVFPEDREVGMPQIRKAVEAQTPFEIEYRIVTAGGEVRWVWEKGEGVFDDAGRLLFIEGFITDVHDKKMSELALAQSNQNYKSLIDSSPEGVFIFRDDRLVFANPSALEIMEAESFEEIRGKISNSFLAEEYREPGRVRIDLAKKGVPLPFVEIKMKTLKGNVRDIEAKPIAIKFDGHDAVQVVLHDIAPQKQLISEQLRAQIAEETNAKLQLEINERKTAERILQETQNYTRLLIDSSVDMICASDPAGLITEFNAAARAKFGYELEEVLGKPVSMLYANPLERKRITEEELYTVGKFSGEVLNIKKNGEQFISFLSASILRDNDGNILGSMGVSRDISEIKKAEEKLKLSEEKYRAIYDQAYIGIARVGLKDGNFIEVNQRLCDILGYGPEELTQMSTWQITHPDDLVTNLPERRAFLKSGSNILSTEKRYIHKTGSVVYANLTITLVKDSDGIPQYFVSVYEDITERKKAEEKLYAQSAKLHAVFENSSHIIWTLDRNSCVTSYNSNFAKFFKANYGVDVSIGLNMVSGEMVSSEEYNDFWIRKYEAVFRGERQHFETRLNREDGAIWREIFLNPIVDESGNVIELSGIGHDITEKKVAEEKIRQSLQEKEVLLKEVHHRVKNNLQVISSILNLQSSYVRDASTINILKESQNRIKSMAFIHESLYQTKDFSSINFSEYVINLSQNLIHSYSNVEHEIELKLDIQNVFLNLDLAIPCGLIINEIVSNALKYAFVDDSRANEISITMKVSGDDLVLTIGDNGIGLPPTIDYRNTESLGLQLVVTLTDQLNGCIELDTRAGTTYTINFKQTQVKNRI